MIGDFAKSNGVPKTLVIGAKGYIGSHFLSFYQKIHPDTIGTHYLPKKDLKCLNLECPEKSLPSLGDLYDYSYALIAGGICNPKKCEEEPDASYRVNVDGIFALCASLLEKKITPIFISSGYVFNGKKGSYLEGDPTDPVNAYGVQKCALESKLQETFGDQCLIVRVAKVYGLDWGDQTLLDEIASSLYLGKKVFVAEDQILSPISISDAIRGISHLQFLNCRGVYHLGGPEAISRYDLAIKIAKVLEIDEHLVVKVSLDQIPSIFKRAKRTDLISEKFLKQTNIQLTSVHENIERHFCSSKERLCGNKII